MKIDEVITQAIIAIYSEPKISNILFLKGGAAMRIFDNITSRLSIDADFSIAEGITDEKKFFNLVNSSIGSSFRRLKFDIIDFRWMHKPRKKKDDKPDWWGGWACEFKLVSFRNRGKSLETKRRNSLIPEGANSPKISIEISEYEYCERSREKIVEGVRIFGYSRELLVLEKIRAICQQHPDYPYRLSGNRARDFYDIYELTINMDDDFLHRCGGDIKKVFDAKEVPLTMLNSLWSETFIDEQRRGFDEVKDTVRVNLNDFDVYVEYLRFLVKDIYPKVQ